MRWVCTVCTGCMYGLLLYCVCGYIVTLYCEPCIYGYIYTGVYTVYTYTVYILYLWQGNREIHGHIRCIYTRYIWCIYRIYGREIAKYTVKYGVYIQFWPTLVTYGANLATAAFFATVATTDRSSMLQICYQFYILPLLPPQIGHLWCKCRVTLRWLCG